MGGKMKLLTQPKNSGWCGLYSLAMLLDVKPEILIAEIGHDGQKIIFPHKTGDIAKRGFTISELHDCCMLRGYSLSLIVCMPAIALNTGEYYSIWEKEYAITRFHTCIGHHKGLIVGGKLLKKDSVHCVAWDGKKIYDPHGKIYGLGEGDFAIKDAWLLSKLI